MIKTLQHVSEEKTTKQMETDMIRRNIPKERRIRRPTWGMMKTAHNFVEMPTVSR